MEFMFLTPKKFSEITGENYELILKLCKKDKILCEKTDGGHYKIYESEIERFSKLNKDFVSKEDYEKVIRENERLKQKLEHLKVIIDSL